MEKIRNRRRFYRILLSPRFQLKYAAYFAVMAITSLIFSCGISIYFFIQLIRYAHTNDPSQGLSDGLYEFLSQNPVALVAGLVVTAFIYTALAVVFSRHIAGPMHALCKHIDALKAGDYAHKTRLRQYDELKPLMHSLNELSDTLASKHGTKPADHFKRAGSE